MKWKPSGIISKNNLSKDEFNIIKEQLKIDLIDLIN